MNFEWLCRSIAAALPARKYAGARLRAHTRERAQARIGRAAVLGILVCVHTQPSKVLSILLGFWKLRNFLRPINASMKEAKAKGHLPHFG